MEQLYPLKFIPIFKDKIWGGDKIKTILKKDFTPLPNCGETWEISGVKGDVSVVENGELTGQTLSTVLEKYKDELVGKKVYEHFGKEFPLLVKFIDANEDLSIQVHPNDVLAKERHNSFGKTEMWYIIQADPGSTLISGFNQELDEETYLKKFNAGQLTDILNKEEVKAGDVFFLPAGRVHTIGKGLLLAEIQQTSDVTYRIFDFDRRDVNGNTRELHTEQALAAFDYHLYPDYKTIYEPQQNHPVELVKCPYFTTNLLEYNQNTKRNYQTIDSFVIYVCVQGSVTVVMNKRGIEVNMGECILLPATAKEIHLETSEGFKLLESYIE